MKISKSALSLMLALAAGSAAAAPLTPTAVSAGTTAGKAIVNQASASFTDPTTGNAATPVTSNAVTTTVNPITGFDIVYSDGSADGTTATVPAASYDKADVVAGSTVITKYTVLNNSNIDGYVINLTADVATVNATGSTVTLAAGRRAVLRCRQRRQPHRPGPDQGDARQRRSAGHRSGHHYSGCRQPLATSSRPARTVTRPSAATPPAYPTAPTAGTFAAYDENSNDTVNTPANDLEFTARHHL